MNNSNHYLVNEKPNKLVFKFAIPCIMSLLVASLYNIVDQIFIGQGIGYLGNGATNVVYPITVISLAFSLLIGDGTAAYISICQGRKDEKSCSKSVGNAITLLISTSIIFVLLLIFFQDVILNLFGATENNYQYAVEYYRIIIIGIPFFTITNGLNSIIRADGSPKFAMITIVIGAIVNIILDPIMIFVLKWGMTGAAIATILGQIVTTVFAIIYMRKPHTFTLSKSSFLLNKKILSKITSLGISSFLTQFSNVVILGVMNSSLVLYGGQSIYGEDIPLTVVGILLKTFQIVIAFVVGISAGAQPIIGYNYGAGEYDRVKKIYKIIIISQCIVGLISTLLFECFPLQIISIFGSESQLYNEFAVLAFRIYLSTILLCCIQKATSIFLQSLGKPVMSMSLSLLREIILIVPLVFLLGKNYGVVAILYSAPIADTIMMIFVVTFTIKVMKELNTKKLSN